MSSQQNGKTSLFTIDSESSTVRKAPKKKPFWHIDRKMFRFKLHFFLFSGALGSSLPFITIFAKDRVGMSASALAAIATTQRLLFIFTKPLIGYIADYFNKLKAIIGILTIIQTVFLFLLLAIPKIQRGHKTDIMNNETASGVLVKHFNTSQLQLNCDSCRCGGTSSENTVVCFANNDNSELCCLPNDQLSKFSDQCSSYTTERKQLATHWSTNMTMKNNECKVCCRTSGDCHTLECNVSKCLSATDTSLEAEDRSDFQTYQFWCFALFATVAMICANGLFTLSDTACCESVQKTGSDFGRQRLWSGIGWGLICPVGGLLNDYTDDYVASWTLMSLVSVVAIVNIVRLELVKPQFSQNVLKDFGSVLRSREFLAFKAGVLMSGVGTGIMWVYLFWFLTTIGGSRFLCGVVPLVQCIVGEIPFMYYSGWVIRKLGHFNILTLALFAYCVRFFWYSRLHNPWLVLPVEIVHGFTYGLFYPAVASYAKMSAKPGTEATTQAVLFTAQEGLGPAIGSMLAGLGFDALGAHRTFFFCGVFVGCGMVLNIVLHLCVRRNRGIIHVTTPVNT